ncbi:MAG TPA: DHA2 family efflux MFS transporter permease subunit [Candidatus Binataceae bacterium]|nr:DHA2 family efflux MFS transporter permease subunit [Candidatus Binataceae bacterium]
MAAATTIAGELPLETTATSHKWLVAIAVMLGAALEVLDNSIINVALPHLQGTFSASVDEIAWVLTSYLVANGIMIPMTGWISSRFGRKRYFMTSLFVFVSASALCGAAQSLDQMVVFRLLQGAAGAAMIPSSQAILMETFPPAQQQMAMAIWGMGLMVAPIAGPTLGGWITDNWNWRWNFYINLPIGMLAFAMVYTFVHDPPFMRDRRARGGRVDYAGITLLVLSVGLLQIVLDRGQRADWFEAPWVVCATAASAIGFILLVARELTFPEPILDLRIFKERAFVVSLILTIAMSFVLFGSILLNPLFLQELLGYSAWKTGLVQAPLGICSATSMMMTGQLSRLGLNTRPLVGVGFVLIALGAWRMAGMNLQVSMMAVLKRNIVMSFGFGMVFPNTSAAALSCVPRERVGYAASLYNMLRNTGAAIGIAFMTNSLISREQVHQSHLVEHFSIFDAWRMGHTLRPGAMQGFAYLPEMGRASPHGLAMLYGLVRQQAMMLAFNDIYRMIAIGLIPLIPLFLLLPSSKASGASAPSH